VSSRRTNTIVEYDFWRMLMKNDVEGVGLHQGHILIRKAKWSTGASALARNIQHALTVPPPPPPL
jgi:hypothetical protein